MVHRPRLREERTDTEDYLLRISSASVFPKTGVTTLQLGTMLGALQVL